MERRQWPEREDVDGADGLRVRGGLQPGWHPGCVGQFRRRGVRVEGGGRGAGEVVQRLGGLAGAEEVISVPLAVVGQASRLPCCSRQARRLPYDTVLTLG